MKNTFQKSLSLIENYMNILLTLIIPQIFASKQKQWISFFRKKYYKSTGYTVHGFTFAFPKVKTSISDIINPKNNLINVENGLEEAVNGLSADFFSLKKEYWR